MAIFFYHHTCICFTLLWVFVKITTFSSAFDGIKHLKCICLSRVRYHWPICTRDTYISVKLLLTFSLHKCWCFDGIFFFNTSTYENIISPQKTRQCVLISIEKNVIIPIFWLQEKLMKVIPETDRAH